MSWSVELALARMELANELQTGPLPGRYMSDWRSQEELQLWLKPRQVVQSFEVSYEAWDVFVHCVIMKLPSKDIRRMDHDLFVFGASCSALTDDCWKLPSTAARRIRRFSRAKCGYSVKVLHSMVVELHDEIRAFVKSLRPPSAGMVRVYEWGKF